MTEPQAKPGGSQDERGDSPSAPIPSAPAEIRPVTARDLLLGGNAKPTDDAPTIISRTSQALVRPDETLAGVLRGQQLAHFELLQPIGVGGMAAVIQARDTQLDRTVALKILPPEMAGDPENVRRFHQEARAAAKLDHENIARVFFCGEDQGLHFIAFEFVEGKNLSSLLEQRGRIPVPEAVGYMLQVASGLAHAASRGVVHRDIKPSNIIITPTGRAKLVDMGLARSLEPQREVGLTQSGVTLGTFDYISPEQALEPREADVRSDVYSLGCTFYHMLTGQPPVPDGTAAKKLHYHQHVDPVDPRQLNPEIPDDVTALLARMMAKDPKKRYQRPEQLVRHLIALAEKLGTAGEVPDGILFVDAPLPGPPRARPLLLATVALLALILLVSVLPRPSPAPRASAPPDNSGTADGVSASEPKAALARSPSPSLAAQDHTPAAVQESESDTFQASEVKGLVECMAKHPNAKVIRLSDDLDITQDEMLVFQGRDLTLRAADPDHPPTIRLHYAPLLPAKPWIALTVKGGVVKIEGVRFEVDAVRAPDITMAAVALKAGHLTLENCEFNQLQLPESGQGQVSSVLVSGSAAQTEMPALVLRQCYFASGQHAVLLASPASIQALQCAFAPHTAALFRLQDEHNRASQLESALNLRNCSAFLGGDAVFRMEDGVSSHLRVENCIFSGPEVDTGFEYRAAFVEQTGDSTGDLDYTGLHNCYHNIKPYWLQSSGQGAQKAITDLATFRKSFREDEKSIELAKSPWRDPDPLEALQEDEPRRAFRVNVSLPQLRQARDRDRVIGVERCVWGISYPTNLPPLEEKKPPEPVVRKEEKVIVLGNSSYTTLRQALDDAKPGDVVLIKKNGLLPVEPVRLDKAGIDITIRPSPNYHPVLTLGETPELDAALFRVHDGQLKLEHLEFRLLPGRPEFKAQTVVAVVGDGQCSFKDCVVTLGENRDVPLSLVTLVDPSGAMKMEPPASAQQNPKVAIEGSFVRGAGDLVTVRPSRPFELKVEKSLMALEGSLLVVEGGSRESPSGGRAKVNLGQVTTYLTEHLLCLRALKEEGKSTRGLVPIQVKSVTGCLFVPAGSKSLIHLDGIDTEEQMKRNLSWEESRHNAYGNFNQLLDQQPSGGEGSMMPPPPYGKTQWEDFAQEQDGRFDRVKFAALPKVETRLARVVPDAFKTVPEANLQGYGVDLDSLPKLYEEATFSTKSSGD